MNTYLFYFIYLLKAYTLFYQELKSIIVSFHTNCHLKNDYEPDFWVYLFNDKNYEATNRKTGLGNTNTNITNA